MPRGDGTGPSGQGPLTGRGTGFCAGGNRSGRDHSRLTNQQARLSNGGTSSVWIGLIRQLIQAFLSRRSNRS